MKRTKRASSIPAASAPIAGRRTLGKRDVVGEFDGIGPFGDGPDQRDRLPCDVSCDEGMRFSWARATSFTEPVIEVGNGVHYYAIDYSPSYLWNSATWETSEALLPHLGTVLDGPTAWDKNSTIARAIEIRDGIVQNPRILSFQNRAGVYPRALRTPARIP
jgi:hypothetical protein